MYRGCQLPKAKGDVNGDGKSDIVLTRGSGMGPNCAGETWGSIPVAFSTGNGDFTVSNAAVPNFPAWTLATVTNGGQNKVVMGDFDGNGTADLAALGGMGWTSIPVAFSNGNGTFRVTNDQVADFPGFAYEATQIVVGDFNGDGKDDIAVAGGWHWASQPIAFSNGDGTFRVTNDGITNFATWAQTLGILPQPKLLAGDFNGDGIDDLALIGGQSTVQMPNYITGGPIWNSIPIALSHGDGTFAVWNQAVPNMNEWAMTAGARVVVGDFNGDLVADVAVAGGQGWGSVPVAFGKGDGTFNVSNQGSGLFPTFASQATALVAGDFNRDGKTDLALTGGNGWGSIPVGFSKGDGTFDVTNNGVANFPEWATSWNLNNASRSYSDWHLPLALSGSSDNLFDQPVLQCDPAQPSNDQPPGNGGGLPGQNGGTGNQPTCGLPGQPCCTSGMTCEVGVTCQIDSNNNPVCESCGGFGQACCSTPTGETCGRDMICTVDMNGFPTCGLGQ